jgi:PilZ domain
MSASSIAWAPRGSEPPRGAACRVYERHACDLPAACQPIAARSDGDILWSATIRDVSEGGVGLVLGRRFERGAGLAIELPGGGDQPSETLLAKVVNLTSTSGGKWLLGCAFVSRLSEDQVQRVVELANILQTPPAQAPLPQTSDADKTTVMPLIIHDLWFEGTTHEGRIVKVPVRRLFLTGSWPLAPGTTLRVWVGDKSKHPEGIRVKVVACQQQAGGWTVSYRPLEPLSVQTLHALGFAG